MAGLGATGVSEVDDFTVARVQELAPARAELQERYGQYEPYARFAGDIGPSVAAGDTAAMTEWGEQALRAYASEQLGFDVNNINTSRDIVRAAQGYGEQYLKESYGISLSLEGVRLQDAMRDLAYAGCTYATGINPQLAEVTLNALSDGKLTTTECESIGGTAGAIAGAAVCQAFGIPAPIGAWLGGAFGSSIGTMIGEITGMSARERWKAEEEARHAALAQLYEYGNKHCKTARARYWMTFDEMLAQVGGSWERLECLVGARFAVRYWGPSPRPTGATCRHPFGCPYPHRHRGTAGRYERVASAYRVWGLDWPSCNERVICTMPRYTSGQSVNSYRQQVEAWVGGNEWPSRVGIAPTFAPYQARMRALTATTMRITGDLTKTASVVQTEMDMHRQKVQLQSTGKTQQSAYIAAMLDRARLVGERRTRALNYGALALGGAGLGYVLWKGRSG